MFLALRLVILAAVLTQLQPGNERMAEKQGKTKPNPLLGMQVQEKNKTVQLVTDAPDKEIGKKISC